MASADDPSAEVPVPEGGTETSDGSGRAGQRTTGLPAGQTGVAPGNAAAAAASSAAPPGTNPQGSRTGDVYEVSGTQTPLLQAIEDSEIPMPELMNFKHWREWRESTAKRPRIDVDGFTTSTAQEQRLWKTVMSTIHGVGWLDDLRNSLGLPASTRVDPTQPSQAPREGTERSFNTSSVGSPTHFREQVVKGWDHRTMDFAKW